MATAIQKFVREGKEAIAERPHFDSDNLYD